MVCVRMVNVRCDEDVEDIVRISCCTVESLLVIEEGYWVLLKALKGTEEWMEEWRNKVDEG